MSSADQQVPLRTFFRRHFALQCAIWQPMDYADVASELVRALRGRRSQTAFSKWLGYRSNVASAWEAGARVPDGVRLLLRSGAERAKVGARSVDLLSLAGGRRCPRPDYRARRGSISRRPARPHRGRGLGAQRGPEPLRRGSLAEGRSGATPARLLVPGGERVLAPTRLLGLLRRSRRVAVVGSRVAQSGKCAAGCLRDAVVARRAPGDRARRIPEVAPSPGPASSPTGCRSAARRRSAVSTCSWRPVNCAERGCGCGWAQP